MIVPQLCCSCNSPNIRNPLIYCVNRCFLIFIWHVLSSNVLSYKYERLFDLLPLRSFHIAESYIYILFGNYKFSTLSVKIISDKEIHTMISRKAMAAYWISIYKCVIFQGDTYFQQIAEGRNLLPPYGKERKNEMKRKYFNRMMGLALVGAMTAGMRWVWPTVLYGS